MSYTEEIDVLDLLIEILMDYENRMDELVTRMELLVEHIEVEDSLLNIDPDVEPSLVDVIEDVE